VLALSPKNKPPANKSLQTFPANRASSAKRIASAQAAESLSPTASLAPVFGRRKMTRARWNNLLAPILLPFVGVPVGPIAYYLVSATRI
jgi:hypothetical protein